MTAGKTKESKKTKKPKDIREAAEKKEEKEEKPKFSLGGLIKKLFGGIEMTWKRVIIFAILAGIYTALMALLVPDGNSFHDIVATPEAWVLLAIIVIVNCKKPLEAALKVFVFFLISQPLVYLIQVPFNILGWGLFGYYPYWFKITLLTLPGGFIAWFVKKDIILGALVFSVAAAYLILTGVGYVTTCTEQFPNHLLSAIYCFAIIPIMCYGIFTKRTPKLIIGAISIVVLVAILILVGGEKDLEAYRSLSDFGVEYGNGALVSHFSGTKRGNVTVIDAGEFYTLRITGRKGGEYHFSIEDDSGKTINFKYHFDSEQLILEEEKK